MSIIYPTIFSLGIHGSGEQTKIGSSFVVMSIVGGAIMPFLMGWLADNWGMRIGFLLPLLCFIFIAFYGAIWRRTAGGAYQFWEGLHEGCEGRADANGDCARMFPNTSVLHPTQLQNWPGRLKRHCYSPIDLVRKVLRCPCRRAARFTDTTNHLCWCKSRAQEFPLSGPFGWR